MSNNPNDALLYRLQQMNINNNGSTEYSNFSPNSSMNRRINQPSNYPQPVYQYMSENAAGGIYENVEYGAGTKQLVTDLDAIDQNFESSNAKAQPQLRPSNENKGNFNQEHETTLRYAHTPQPSELEAPIYENLQVISG